MTDEALGAALDQAHGVLAVLAATPATRADLETPGPHIVYCAGMFSVALGLLPSLVQTGALSKQQARAASIVLRQGVAAARRTTQTLDKTHNALNPSASTASTSAGTHRKGRGG